MKKTLLIIFSFFLFLKPAIALIEVDITRGNLEPLPIAVSPLYLDPNSQDIKQGEKIIQNIGENAGQTVPHLHFHIIPKYPESNHSFIWEPKPIDHSDATELSKAILQELE